LLYIISGPSSVGKSVIVTRFIEYKGFKGFTPFTSRARRVHENEIEGRDYFFRNKEDLVKISKDFTIGYWDFVFDEIYGYSSDIINAINSQEKYIIHGTTKIALSIKHDFPSVLICFIDFKTNEEFEKRIMERFSPNMKLINGKIENAKIERESISHYDIYLQSDDLDALYEELVKLFLP
jgi:guanylate kinase